MDVRVGKGKWSLAIWLGLDEDWFEKTHGQPGYIIHLCNKSVGETFGKGQDGYSTWRPFGEPCAHRRDKMFRVCNPLWWKPWTDDNRGLAMLDFENSHGAHYNVRWRKR